MTQIADQTSAMKKTLLEVAEEYMQRGPGFAQEGPVLAEVTDRLRIGNDLAAQQDLLTCWHDLFLSRELSWGYNIDNPSNPFFHIPRRATASSRQ